MGARLTPSDRARIARRLEAGEAAAALAQEFGVSRGAVYGCRPRAAVDPADPCGVATISLKLSRGELVAFDAALAAHRVASRSKAIRTLMRRATGELAPDDAVAAELGALRRELAKAGVNVNQVARRLNEARRRGERVIADERDLRRLAELSRTVDAVGQVAQALAEGRAGRGTALPEALAALERDEERP